MNCLICRQADLADGLTSISFEREEFRLLINHVPAQICPSCGEAVVGEDVAACLLTMAEDVASEGLFEEVRDYGK